MTGSNPKIEILNGRERRRRWSTAETLSMVEETYAPKRTRSRASVCSDNRIHSNVDPQK
jgi:hypothetical protein